MGMLLVEKKDFDPDLTWKTIMTTENAFLEMASLALEYLEESELDDDDNVKKVIAAIQAEDVHQLLKPLNDYVYNFNGEYYVISSSDGEPHSGQPSTSQGEEIIDDVRKRISEVVKRMQS